MSKNLISLLGVGPALRGLVDYLRDWRTADRRREAEAQLAEERVRREAEEATKTGAETKHIIVTAMKTGSEAERLLAEAEKLRAEAARIHIENANAYLSLVEKHATLPGASPDREAIGRALGLLQKHLESGAIRQIRLVEDGDAGEQST